MHVRALVRTDAGALDVAGQADAQQPAVGTTMASPASRPTKAAPICWRNQPSSSCAMGWRQVEGIGIGSSS